MKRQNKSHGLNVTICVLLIIFIVELAYLYKSNSEYEAKQNSLLSLFHQKNFAYAQSDSNKIGREESAGKNAQEKQRLEDIFFSSSLLSLHKVNVVKTIEQYKETYGYRILPIENLWVNVSDQGDRVSLVWKKYENPPEKIVIYRSQTEKAIGDVIAEIDGYKDGYQDTDVVVGHDYFYTVVAESGEYKSLPGKASTIKLTDLTPPQAPLNVKTFSDFENGGISITWENPADKDFAYVKIYRSETPEFLGKIIVNRITDNEYLDTSVKTNKDYYYTLISVDIHGNETPHGDLSATMLGNPNPFQPLLKIN